MADYMQTELCLHTMCMYTPPGVQAGVSTVNFTICNTHSCYRAVCFHQNLQPRSGPSCMNMRVSAGRRRRWEVSPCKTTCSPSTAPTPQKLCCCPVVMPRLWWLWALSTKHGDRFSKARTSKRSWKPERSRVSSCTGSGSAIRHGGCENWACTPAQMAARWSLSCFERNP